MKAIREYLQEAVKLPVFKNIPDHVKGWAEYVAQHEDGVWWYYETIPDRVSIGWKSDREYNQFASNVKTDPKNWDSTYYTLDVKTGKITPR